ncbi:PD-(D/E)XK motif protein [Streptomyces sp. NPDC096068]|uniref:PD-(D/E)XK motif protein n=1 Tax=Streptomyces sp. NPDC096068 TaxID=3155424 RepID=UPI0033168176
MTPSDAHVSWSSVEHYLGARQETSYRLSRSASHPEVTYAVTDAGTGIALYVELKGRHRPPTSPLPSILIDTVAERGKRMARIRTTQETLLRDFHDLLNAVADRIVVRNRTLDQAFSETVRAWSALLGRSRDISVARRIGLMGELAVLASVAEAQGWPTALESWKGPDGEEHDFGLSDIDVEVKTTSSEHRRHTVHGIGQMSPTTARELWLVSIQLTRGGSHGKTLSDCAHTIRRRVSENSPASLDRLDHKLMAAGWDPEFPDDERWHLRNTPVPLRVDATIPHLDDSVIPSGMHHRIDDITYTIDVSGLPPSAGAPSVLADISIP